MFAVRYAALIALVLWVGALARDAGWMAADAKLGLACGAGLIVLLFMQKFIGPPPASFVPRLTIVASMLALAFWNLRSASPAIDGVEFALGAVLLAWYARE